MPASPTETEESPKTISFRVPARVEREVAAVAHREGNPLSATLRRLVTFALRSESEELERRG